MRPDVLTQLHVYTEHMDTLTPSADELLLERATPLRPTLTRRRSRWPVAVAAAVVTLLLFGGLAFLNRSGPVVDQPTPTTVPTTLSTEAVPGRWVRTSISTGPDLDPESVNALAAGGPGVVAVGRERVILDAQGGASSDRATIWTSPDGLVWTRVPYDEEVFGTNGAVIDIAHGPAGLVAIGSADGLAAIWTSSDGLTWKRLSEDAAPLGGSTLYRVIADSETVVVLGFGGSFVGSGPEPTLVVDEEGQPLDDISDWIDTQRVWVSTDSQTWNRVSDEAIFAGARIDPGAAAVGPDAVLVGETCTVRDATSLSCEPTVWLSGDGQTWERHVRPGPDFAEVGVGDMVWFESRLVAVTMNPSAPVWTSTDGVTWTEIPADEVAFPTIGPEFEGEPAGPVRLNAVAVGSDGLVAVGRGGDEQGSEVPAIWMSLDGTHWTRVPHDATVFGPAGDVPGVIDIVAVPGGFVAAGDVIVETECQEQLLSLCRVRSVWVWRDQDTGG